MLLTLVMLRASAQSEERKLAIVITAHEALLTLLCVNARGAGQVHQFGLKDRPNPHSEDIQYPKRQLLGINRKNELLIEGLTAEYLVQV